MQDILNIFGVIGGIVSVIELLEFLVTKNIPWLVRLLIRFIRRLRRLLGGRPATGDGRYLVLNFSGHPLKPGQIRAIKSKMDWPEETEVINAELGDVSEKRHFVTKILNSVEKIDLLPREWQEVSLVVVPAGYTPIWSVLLAELHGRLGYFPDMVRMRPSDSEEKYEVAEIVSLQQIRNQARGR